MVTWYIVGIPTKTNFEHIISLLLIIGGLFRAMAQMTACNFLDPPSKYLLNFKSKILGKIGQKSDIANALCCQGTTYYIQIKPTGKLFIRSIHKLMWKNPLIETVFFLLASSSIPCLLSWDKEPMWCHQWQCMQWLTS